MLIATLSGHRAQCVAVYIHVFVPCKLPIHLRFSKESRVMLTIMHHSRYDLLNKYLLTVNKRQKTSLFKYQDSMFFANLLIKGYAQALLPSMYLDREIMVQSPTSSWVNIYFSGQLLNKVRRWGYSQSQWATSNTNITPKQTWNWVGRLLRPKIKSKISLGAPIFQNLFEKLATSQYTILDIQ